MTINKCVVQNCEKPKRRNGEATQYCHMHYKRFLTKGDVGQAEALRVFSYSGKLCSVDDCKDLAKKKNFCTHHYDSQKRSSLSANEIEKMKKFGCYVCGSFSRLTLDHDHSCCETGKSCENCIRGILCHKCNTAAGLLDDNYERMISLASYIISNSKALKHAKN